MTILVIVTDAIENTAHERSVDIDEKTTISDLFSDLKIYRGDFSVCYPLCGIYYRYREIFPFLFVDNSIHYDVPYADAKAIDLVNTIAEHDRIIQVLADYPLAGGLGAPDIYALWDSIYFLMNHIAVIYTFYQASRDTIKPLIELFKKKKKMPNTIFDIVYSRKQWNHHELAELLVIDTEKAKDLLKLLGYTFDNKKRLYVQGEHIDEIQKQWENIPLIDC